MKWQVGGEGERSRGPRDGREAGEKPGPEVGELGVEGSLFVRGTESGGLAVTKAGSVQIQTQGPDHDTL